MYLTFYGYYSLDGSDTRNGHWCHDVNTRSELRTSFAGRNLSLKVNFIYWHDFDARNGAGIILS